MKRTLLPMFLCLLLVESAPSQMRIIYPDNVKVIASPLPSFPVEAKNLIYGDEVRVLLDIDTHGQVKGAIAYGPLAPCSERQDPTVNAVRNAALSAARVTTFEPVLRNGKAVEERLSIGYRLRAVQSPLPDEERKIVNIGVANGRAKTLTRPEYPESARAARLSGGIMVQGHRRKREGYLGRGDLRASAVR